MLLYVKGIKKICYHKFINNCVYRRLAMKKFIRKSMFILLICGVTLCTACANKENSTYQIANSLQPTSVSGTQNQGIVSTPTVTPIPILDEEIESLTKSSESNEEEVIYGNHSSNSSGGLVTNGQNIFYVKGTSIMRADMDGNNVETMIKKVGAFDLSEIDGWLYFTNKKDILRLSVDGGEPEVIYATSNDIPHIYGLNVVKDTMYFSEFVINDTNAAKPGYYFSSIKTDGTKYRQLCSLSTWKGDPGLRVVHRIIVRNNCAYITHSDDTDFGIINLENNFLGSRSLKGGAQIINYAVTKDYLYFTNPSDSVGNDTMYGSDLIGHLDVTVQEKPILLSNLTSYGNTLFYCTANKLYAYNHEWGKSKQVGEYKSNIIQSLNIENGRAYIVAYDQNDYVIEYIDVSEYIK